MLRFCLWLIGVLALSSPGFAQSLPTCPSQTQSTNTGASVYTLSTNDYCWDVILTNPGNITVKLPAPGPFFFPGFTVSFVPINKGTITFQVLGDDAGRPHYINGNSQTSLALAAGQSATIKAQQDLNWWLVAGAVPGSTGGAPGGSNGQIQYNNSGTFGGLALGGALTTAANTLNVAAGGISNAMLANSSITLGTTGVSLGSTASSLSGLSFDCNLNTCLNFPGGSSAFSSLTAGTNTTAAMVVGTGASLAASGSGTIAATSVPNTAVTPGSYTNTNLTVAADGRITAASNGSAGSSTGFGVDGGTTPTTYTGSGTQSAIPAGSREVDITSISGAMTIPMPSIASFGANKCFRAHDYSGSVSGTNTVTFSANGTDVINNGSAGGNSPAFSTANFSAWFCTISGKWNISAGATVPAIAANGVLSGLAAGGAWTQVTTSTANQLLVSGANAAPSFDANATANAGALTLGASGTAGSVTMGNATSGTITLQPVTGALGSITASIPAHTGNVAIATGAITSTHCAQFSGTDGQIVDSGGACGGGGVTCPTGFTASVGGLCTQTISSAGATATFDFVNLNNSIYSFTCTNIKGSATNSRTFAVQMGTGTPATPTWDATSGHYLWEVVYSSAGSPAGAEDKVATYGARVGFTDADTGGTSTRGSIADLKSSNRVHVEAMDFHANSGATVLAGEANNAVYTASAQVVGLRFQLDNGENMASGSSCTLTVEK
jgi:hypothetical protein